MPEPTRVAVTVEQCWQPVPGGSGSYVAELTRALTDLPGVDVVGLAARHGADEQPRPRPTGEVRSAPLPRTALYEAWNRLRRPRAESVTGPVDVVHATTWAVPGRRAPLVVTVHDLAFLREPAHFTARGNAFFRRAMQVVEAEAAAVVVPSAATRDDCLAHGLAVDRLHVVPHGVRADDVDDARLAEWRARHDVPGPYVLWCGTLEPRKNLRRLVDAFARVRASGDVDHDLVVVGPTGWGAVQQELDLVVGSLPRGAVRVLGRLDDADLQTAYAGAAAFASPSLWEGFGMPVLEAMAHGVPVVTSAGSAMAEVTGDLGVLVDPLDVDDVAAGLVRVLADPPPASAVLERAGTYTWEASAAAHLAVYRGV